MNTALIFRILPVIFIILMLPVLTQAGQPMKKKLLVVHYALMEEYSFLTDTVRYPQENEKKEKSREKPTGQEKSEGKPSPNQPDIREVPKARKQTRPPVVKPNIKVKPIKIIRPKIKRP